MEYDKLYRVVIFPVDDSDVKSILETDDKQLAILTAKEQIGRPNVYNVAVSEFELHWKRMVFQTSNVRNIK